MKICKKCGSEFPSWIKIDGKFKNLSNRKFCLECSPYGKHNTIDITKNYFRCSKCKVDLNSTNSYKNHSYCKKCLAEQTLERQRDFKQRCLDYKGNKCEKCGYCRCVAALEFDHTDKDKKDFTISKFKCTSFKKNFDKIKEELDKCDLLCSNCHREEHYN